MRYFFSFVLLAFCEICFASDRLSLPDLVQTVFLVRHGEKLNDGTANPALSEKGQRRANVLSEHLFNQSIETIVVTPYRRTIETARPTALKKHLELSVQNSVQETIETIKNTSHLGSVLVVGHTNTIPEIISMLGGDQIEIEEYEFGNLFVLTLISGKAVSLLRLVY